MASSHGSTAPPPERRCSAVTATTTEASSLPPGPVQVNVNVELVLNGPTDSAPFVWRVPDHEPDAVQSDASVALHVSVTLLPTVTLEWDAPSVTTGDGAETLTLSPSVL